MMAKKVHLRHIWSFSDGAYGGPHYAECYREALLWQLTTDPKKVTCKDGLRRIAKARGGE